MDDSSHVRRRSPLTAAVLLVAFVLGLYVLSIGPMNALHDRGLFGEWDEAVTAFYTPVIWIFLTVPAIRPPLEAWIGIWEDLL